MKYYYLISSLPNISRDLQYSGRDTIEDLFELIERNLAEDHKEYYRALLYQNDNRNLLNLIFEEYHDLRGSHFYRPSVLSIEELRSYRRNRSVLPGYMIDFLMDNSGVLSSYSLREIEIKFRKYFVEYIDNLNSEFVKKFYQWQQKLTSVVSEVNHAKYSSLTRAEVLLHDFTLIGNTYTVDYKSLKGDLKELIEEQDYVGLEQMINALYWDFADNQQSLFDIDAVLSYVVVLLRLSRWKELTAASEDYDFEKLVDDLKKMDRSPKMKVV